MANVAISNRSIFNQRIGNIEQNKVLLPFNVTKEQENKLVGLLSKVKVTFFAMEDKLKIKDLSYQNINIKTTDRNIGNCRFTLAKTYVVTMKNIIPKIAPFYERVIEVKAPERPTFSISNETNLQEALAEATTEINLEAINAGLNNQEQSLEAQAKDNVQTVAPNIIEQPTPQVLVNNPSGETVIDNPVNLNQPTPAEQVANVQQPQVQSVNNVAQQPVNQMQPNVPQMEQPAVQPKVKKRLFSRKGSVLAVPIVMIWLGAVFYGTMKLVMGILT